MLTLEPHAGIEPASSGRKPDALTVTPGGRGGSPLNRPGTSRASTARDSDFTKEPQVGKQGLEPRLPAPRAGALTLTPHPVTSGPPESNRVSPDSGSGRLPSSSIPIAHVETPGIEPGRRCLQGMPPTSAPRPHSRRSDAAAASGRRHLPLWCSRYGRVN